MTSVYTSESLELQPPLEPLSPLANQDNHSERTPSFKKHQVPWMFRDVIFIAMIFVMMPSFYFQLLYQVPPQYLPSILQVPRSQDPSNTKDLTSPPPAPKSTLDKELSRSHPLTELLVRSTGTPDFGLILFFILLTGVVAAPVTEEFIFRVVFQGTLERYIPEQGASGRFWRLILAIVFPALVFGLIHYRASNETRDINNLLATVFIIPLAHFTTLILGSLWLIRVRGATKEDLGLSGSGLWCRIGDIVNGVKSFLIIAPFLFFLQWFLNRILPEMVLDPVAIFFFALGLGILYWKTHRFLAVVTMHFALNFSSFLALLLSLQQVSTN